jgi:hypothetical protein
MLLDITKASLNNKAFSMQYFIQNRYQIIFHIALYTINKHKPFLIAPYSYNSGYLSLFINKTTP